MKPISIVHLISSLRKGGRERQLATIYKYTDRNRFPTKIICFNDADQDFLAQYGLQEDIYFLKTKGWKNRLLEIRRLISSGNFTFIYSWGESESLYGLFISMITPAKFINGSVRHGILSLTRSQIVRMLVLHLSRRIVANSKAGLKANFLSHGEVLYNGVDEHLIAPFPGDKSCDAHTPDTERKDQDVPLILSVANLVPYKDYETIIRVLASLKRRGFNFRYIIVGDGPMRTTVEARVNESGLSDVVTFSGQVTNVTDFYRCSDILIHSSKGEGCSNTILEAMFHGISIIASDTGGTEEILIDGTGYLFPYRNTGMLAEKLALLLADSQLCRAMGERAREHAMSRFTAEIMIENYYRILTRFAYA